MLWMETPKPSLDIAREYAEGIHAENPNVLLSYNLSPSFNWDESGMTDEEIRQFIPKLAAMGFCWQFITLAGFHIAALGAEVFAKAFAKQDMLAYVQQLQRRERQEGVDQLKHQKWSGVELKDREMEVAAPFVVSTKATSEGITEAQFQDAKL